LLRPRLDALGGQLCALSPATPAINPFSRCSGEPSTLARPLWKNRRAAFFLSGLGLKGRVLCAELGDGGGQPGKPKPPGNPPNYPDDEDDEDTRPPIDEPPMPIPVPPIERPPAPMASRKADQS
jgi:hypothetical protein